MSRQLLRNPVLLILLLPGLFLLAGMASCRKADKMAESINQQPFVVIQPSSLFIPGIGSYNGYRTSYLVGDTAFLVGRLFIGQPGSSIRVGNELAKIAWHIQINMNTGSDSLNPYTGKPDKLDVVKFVITSGMGTGNNIPVTITAGGISLQAPALSIQKIQGSLNQTDTTLYVDSLAGWLPADAQQYQRNGQPLVQGMSVSGGGAIWFNNRTGIYAVENGQVNTKLRSGDQLTGSDGTAISLKLILSSVISFAGDKLTFSAEVLENTPDTATNYIFRLCQLDLASNTVTTLNRTLLPKAVAAANTSSVLFQGAAADVPMIAVNLKTDINGALYFLNNYAPPRTDFNPAGFYAGGWGVNHPNQVPQVLNNYCRIGVNLQVVSLFTFKDPSLPTPMYRIPGLAMGWTTDFLITLDGSTAYGSNKMDIFSGNFSMAAVDLQSLLPVLDLGYPSYMEHFRSFDTSAVTGLQQGDFIFSFQFETDYYLYLNSYLPLPGGNILSWSGISLASVSLLNHSAYCYAGTESGLSNYSVPGQTQTTGKAKYVSFNSLNRFSGVDKSGAVYYFSGFNDYIHGLQFYKLYSRR